MRTLYLIAIFLVATNFLFGQTNEKLISIRKTVQAVNADSGYKIKTLANDFFTNVKNELVDKGQELKGYYKNGKLKKVIYKAGLSNCMKTFEYYLDENGALIFVLEKEDVYVEKKDQSGFDYSKLVPAFEGRYYFDQGKLLETKTKGDERSPHPDNSELLNNLEDFKKSLRGKK